MQRHLHRNKLQVHTYTHTGTHICTPSWVYANMNWCWAHYPKSHQRHPPRIPVTHCLCHSLSLCPLSPLPTLDASVTLLLVPLYCSLFPSLAPILSPSFLPNPRPSSLAFFTPSLCRPLSVSLGGPSVSLSEPGQAAGRMDIPWWVSVCLCLSGWGWGGDSGHEERRSEKKRERERKGRVNCFCPKMAASWCLTSRGNSTCWKVPPPIPPRTALFLAFHFKWHS